MRARRFDGGVRGIVDPASDGYCTPAPSVLRDYFKRDRNTHIFQIVYVHADATDFVEPRIGKAR